MIERTELFPGITLRCCRDTRFKQGAMSLQLVREMSREEAAMNALLPAVLLRGTRQHPTLRSITNRLDELYGATVGPMVRRVGDYQTTGIYCGFMDDRFALPGEEVMAPMFLFLRELLLDSPREADGFLPSFVESEKKNLISAIDAELNDKRAYTMSKLLKIMCREDSFGVPRLGEREQVAAIDPVRLYAHYRKILRESPIHIFYVGSAPMEKVASLLRPIFEGLERNCLPLPPQTGFHLCEGREAEETMDIAQGKLSMGFTTGVTNRDPEFAAMQVFNTLYGAGMTSKLFMNVREKQSLCYSISSAYSGSKGLILVNAGIDFDQFRVTRREILRQLELCREGQITDQELNAARQALYSSLRATADSPGAMESYYASAALSGMDLTPEEYMQAVEQVTREQVAECARKVELHSLYFLKGGDADGET